MDHDKKLAFIATMTDKALQHVASVPNVPTPTGGMSHEKMLSFVTAMTKNGLQHLDAGGLAVAGPTVAGPANNVATGGFNGAIGSFLGTNNKFQASGTPIQAGTNAPQLNRAYDMTQDALNKEAGVTSTLNTGLNQGVNAQGDLSGMYLNQINGGGPNPAAARLATATGNNIAEQAALAAGTRGAGANAGLIARENAEQGAQIQQQAVGQGATEEAEQQLAAEQNLQNLSANQIAQGTTATQTLNNANQNEQNILQGANTSANNANVAMQSNINNVNAGISTENQKNSGNILGGIGDALSNIPVIGGLFAEGGLVKMDKGGKVLDANDRKRISPHDFALPGGRYPIHDATHARNALARVAQNGTPAEKGKVRAAVEKKYPGITQRKMAAGGEVTEDKKQVEHMPLVRAPQMMAGGGITGQVTSGPQSYVGQWLNSSTNTQGPTAVGAVNLNTDLPNPFGSKSTSTKGEPEEKVSGNEPFTNITDPATDNPGGGWGSDINAPGAANFDPTNITAGLETGGKVKAKSSGEKAVKKGDSLDNDKIPTMLSEGEVVIDRKTLADPGPVGQMARAVANHIEKRNKGGKA